MKAERTTLLTTTATENVSSAGLFVNSALATDELGTASFVSYVEGTGANDMQTRFGLSQRLKTGRQVEGTGWKNPLLRTCIQRAWFSSFRLCRSSGQRRHRRRVIAVLSRSARWPVSDPLWRRHRLAGCAAGSSSPGRR